MPQTLARLAGDDSLDLAWTSLGPRRPTLPDCLCVLVTTRAPGATVPKSSDCGRMFERRDCRNYCGERARSTRGLATAEGVPKPSQPRCSIRGGPLRATLGSRTSSEGENRGSCVEKREREMVRSVFDERTRRRAVPPSSSFDSKRHSADSIALPPCCHPQKGSGWQRLEQTPEPALLQE